jgi:tRNA-specific 2-thiouridylase
VVVGPKSALLCRSAELCEVNWLGEGAIPPDGIAVEVKHRAQESPVPARLEPTGHGRARARCEQPQAGDAPGQACVVDAGSRVLGGGWIDRAPLAADA